MEHGGRTRGAGRHDQRSPRQIVTHDGQPVQDGPEHGGRDLGVVPRRGDAGLRNQIRGERRAIRGHVDRVDVEAVNYPFTAVFAAGTEMRVERHRLKRRNRQVRCKCRLYLGCLHRLLKPPPTAPRVLTREEVVHRLHERNPQGPRHPGVAPERPAPPRRGRARLVRRRGSPHHQPPGGGVRGVPQRSFAPFRNGRSHRGRRTTIGGTTCTEGRTMGTTASTVSASRACAAAARCCSLPCGRATRRLCVTSGPVPARPVLLRPQRLDPLPSAWPGAGCDGVAAWSELREAVVLGNEVHRVREFHRRLGAWPGRRSLVPGGPAGAVKASGSTIAGARGPRTAGRRARSVAAGTRGSRRRRRASTHSSRVGPLPVFLLKESPHE